jgi:hypothetical protein
MYAYHHSQNCNSFHMSFIPFSNSSKFMSAYLSASIFLIFLFTSYVVTSLIRLSTASSSISSSYAPIASCIISLRTFILSFSVINFFITYYVFIPFRFLFAPLIIFAIPLITFCIESFIDICWILNKVRNTQIGYSAADHQYYHIWQSFGCFWVFAGLLFSAFSELSQSYFGFLLFNLLFEFAIQILSLILETRLLPPILPPQPLNLFDVLLYLFFITISLPFIGFGGSTAPFVC